MSELRELIAEMRAGLEPFAQYIEGGMELDNKGRPLPDDQGLGWIYLTYADFRRARTAYAKAAKLLDAAESSLVPALPEGWPAGAKFEAALTASPSLPGEGKA